MELKIGCKYKVKTVEEMMEKFPMDFYGDILTPATFTKNMRVYCGKTLTIVREEWGWYKADIDNGEYYWDPDMLKPIEGTIEWYLLTYGE